MHLHCLCQGFCQGAHQTGTELQPSVRRWPLAVLALRLISVDYSRRQHLPKAGANKFQALFDFAGLVIVHIHIERPVKPSGLVIKVHSK